MKILKFFDYINESYLKGNLQPLYKYVYHINEIMKSDLLKISDVAADYNNTNIKSMSLTRSIYYTMDDESLIYARLVLDMDKLKTDGYISKPYDEIGMLIGKKKDYIHKKFYPKYSGNDQQVTRVVRNNVGYNTDLPFTIETEYEERIFKDIKNIGKYIISIQYGDDRNIKENIICEYLKKYPHIKIEKYDKKQRWKIKEINVVCPIS